MLLEMEVDRLERERKAVLANPVKHKLTLHFAEDSRLNWRYWRTLNVRGKRVRYCYSSERNLAGYFLGWRETWDAKRGVGKRDQWIASKRRNTVRDKALARTKAHEARLKPKPKKPVEERRLSYWIGERGVGPHGSWSRGLGRVVTTGGLNTALDKARTKWPDAGEIYAVRLGRRD
jgi:hypothetical protein